MRWPWQCQSGSFPLKKNQTALRAGKDKGANNAAAHKAAPAEKANAAEDLAATASVPWFHRLLPHSIRTATE